MKRDSRRSAALLWLVLVLPAASFSAMPQLAVIVDDIGYSVLRGERAIALPAPVTIAIFPFAPHASELADAAVNRGRDVLLHEPMQSVRASDEVPGTLTAQMPAAEFRLALRRAFAALPQAVGVNNHTGSVLTTHREQMDWLMAELAARGLFFVDSRTTAATVAEDAALAAGIPALRRDVFLDDVLEPSAIAERFAHAVAMAERRGRAVLIAHPHEESLAFLERALPELASHGITAVRVSTLIESKSSVASSALASLR